MRATGDHQRPGNQRPHVARPTGLNRQRIEIYRIAFQNNLLTRGFIDDLGCHVQNLFKDRQLFPGIFKTFGWFWLFQKG